MYQWTENTSVETWLILTTVEDKTLVIPSRYVGFYTGDDKSSTVLTVNGQMIHVKEPIQEILGAMFPDRDEKQV